MAGGAGGPRRQRGVALITAVLVAALATLAAVALATEQGLAVRRTANLLDGEQAWLFALGVEGWVAQLLARDAQEGPVDSLGEDWARRLPPLQVEGATVSGRVEDLQGRFNLNSLLDQEGRPDAVALARFRRLLAAVGLDPALADAVLDWMDPDQELRYPGGAEDAYYLGLDPPYRSAGRPFAEVSELRLVAGFDEAAYRRLAPYVAALPGPTPINVNTAPVPVLRALAEGLSEGQAQALAAARGEKGWARAEDFLRAEPLRGKQVDPAGLAVGSGHFLLQAEVRYGRGRVLLYSLLEREGRAVRPLLRARGAYGGAGPEAQPPEQVPEQPSLGGQA